MISNQLRLEGGNDALDKARKLYEQFHQRLRLDDLRLAERYAESELHLLVHFRIGGIDEEFVAYLQGEKDIGGLEEEIKNGNGLALERRVRLVPDLLHQCLHMGTDVDALKHRPHGEQQTVLLDIVKSIEHPKKVIPTFVWFDCVDGVYGCLPRSLYLSQLLGFVFRGVVLNREINPIRVGRVVIGGRANQLVSEMIESTHPVLDGITSHQGDGVWHRLDVADVINQLSRVRIALGRDFIRVGLEKAENLNINVADVLFGPFDFRCDLR